MESAKVVTELATVEDSIQIKKVSGLNRLDMLSDVDLWEAFKKDNEAAFITIYDKYFTALCDFGIQFASQDMVEDAVQDMFIDLRKKRGKLPQIQTSIKAFLFQCLKRRLYNMQKRKREESGIDVLMHKFEILPCVESHIVHNEEKSEKLQKIDKALAGLKPKHREVLYCYFYQNMSYEEVRELIGYDNVKSVRTLVYKLINTLKQSFLFFL